jgi:osmotically-inducible protein OsmY
VIARIIGEKSLHLTSMKVVTERQTVYLLGTISRAEGVLAGDICSQISGVRKVVKMFSYID